MKPIIGITASPKPVEGAGQVGICNRRSLRSRARRGWRIRADHPNNCRPKGTLLA